MKLHTCLAYSAALKCDKVINELLALAEHDLRHREVISLFHRRHALILYEPVSRKRTSFCIEVGVFTNCTACCSDNVVSYCEMPSDDPQGIKSRAPPGSCRCLRLGLSGPVSLASTTGTLGRCRLWKVSQQSERTKAFQRPILLLFVQFVASPRRPRWGAARQRTSQGKFTVGSIHHFDQCNDTHHNYRSGATSL